MSIPIASVATESVPLAIPILVGIASLEVPTIHFVCKDAGIVITNSL